MITRGVKSKFTLDVNGECSSDFALVPDTREIPKDINAWHAHLILN